MIIKLLILISLLGFLFVYFYFFYKIEHLNLLPSFPIDVVVTYVNINDPKFISSIKDLNQIKNLSRFDSNNEILYCLRSIEKNLPFIRNIHLILADEHNSPPFLKKQHYQHKIVYHSQFIPKQYLPTFNSTVIENFLHKIPHLSEHFLYLNDDWIILKNQKWYHFFTPKGLPIQSMDDIFKINDKQSFWSLDKYQLKLNSLLLKEPYSFIHLLNQNNQLLNLILKHQKNRRFSQHIPQALRKSFLIELDQYLMQYKVNDKNLIEFNNQYKFRNNYNLAKISLINKYFCIERYKCPEKIFNIFNITIHSDKDYSKKINEILDCNHDFLNINNEGQFNNEFYKKNYEQINKVLNILFPLKSSFEK